jgi:hypothetical protein
MQRENGVPAILQDGPIFFPTTVSVTARMKSSIAFAIPAGIKQLSL